MTKEELDRKIKSFSEHSGLGKTYSYYETISTSKNEFISHHSGDNLPKSFIIKIRPERKTEILFLVILTLICLFTFMALSKVGIGGNYAAFMIPGISIIIAFIGLDVIGRDEKKRIKLLSLNDKEIRYNKDVFVYTSIQNTLLKKDIKASGKIVALWLIVALKTGELYSYEIPKGYLNKKIRGKFKLQDLLFLYRENNVLNSNIKTGM